jgi:hypothetical protein
MSNFKRQAAIWDKENSLIVQKIEFENGKIITGYSRRVGWSEPDDICKVLCNMMLRMVQEGYLVESDTRKDKIECIEYYINDYPKLIPIVTCFYKHKEFEYKTIEGLPEGKNIVNKVNKIYETLKSGEIDKTIINNYQRKKERYALDINNGKYRTPNDLWEFCLVCIERKRYPSQEVLQFAVQYLNKYFSKHKEFEKWYSAFQRMKGKI